MTALRQMSSEDEAADEDAAAWCNDLLFADESDDSDEIQWPAGSREAAAAERVLDAAEASDERRRRRCEQADSADDQQRSAGEVQRSVRAAVLHEEQYWQQSDEGAALFEEVGHAAGDSADGGDDDGGAVPNAYDSGLWPAFVGSGFLRPSLVAGWPATLVFGLLRGGLTDGLVPLPARIAAASGHYSVSDTFEAAQLPLVVACFGSAGLRKMPKNPRGARWTVRWTASPAPGAEGRSSLYGQLRHGQRYNHFIGSHELGWKHLLHDNIERRETTSNHHHTFISPDIRLIDCLRFQRSRGAGRRTRHASRAAGSSPNRRSVSPHGSRWANATPRTPGAPRRPTRQIPMPAGASHCG